MEFAHKSVLLSESLEGLRIRPDGRYVDGTAGGAGHSREIAKRLGSGRLIAFDQDPDAVKTASERLKDYPQAMVVHDNFRNMALRLRELDLLPVDGVLLDLGVSSWQLDNPARGFSYREDAPLDMRMSQQGETAAGLLARASEREIARILWEYGEERYAGAIAKAIIRARAGGPINTTLQLVDIICSALPAAARREKQHPAKRSFQAIRIAVNGELDALKEGLEAAFRVLKPGGRLAVITFHSLEDRIVKQTFAAYAKGCECPPDFPVCVCGKTPRGKLVNRKPILPTKEEMEQNRRSQSAKLRVLEKIKDEA